MQYKLIAADMDGTLLDPEKKVRDTAIQAIREAMDLGLIFTISTGRPIQGVERYEELFHLLEAPIITYNGAVIIDPRDKSVLYEKSLDPQGALEILSWAKIFGTTVLIWSAGALYIFEHNERTDHYAEMAKIGGIVIEDEAALVRQGITKILWYDEAEQITRFQGELKNTLTGNTTFCTSSPRFLEFFHGGVSKGRALQFLGERYQIHPSEIIAIGDEMNDISMLRYAGLGVAMGNAREEVKEQADFITRSNDEDGVAHVINSFVKK